MHKIQRLNLILILTVACTTACSVDDGSFLSRDENNAIHQWHIEDRDENGKPTTVQIGVKEAWQVSRGAGVTVAVIDSGFDMKHPDLVGSYWTNPDEIPNNQIDDDNNGYVDDVHGWDFCDNDNQPHTDSENDVAKHGTSIAGIIGARDNGFGVTGVAPEAKLMLLKVGCKDPRITGAGDIHLKALKYATAMGARVVNYSISSMWRELEHLEEMRDEYLYNRALEEAAKKQVLFVNAAGNEGFDNDWDPALPSPAVANNVIPVAIIEKDGTFPFGPGGSNYGEKMVFLAAPSEIMTTDPGGQYGESGGTSSAAPVVSGALALLLSAEPHLTVVQVKERLMTSSTPMETLRGLVVTDGHLNIKNLLSNVSSTALPDINWEQAKPVEFRYEYAPERENVEWQIEEPGARSFRLHFNHARFLPMWHSLTVYDHNNKRIGYFTNHITRKDSWTHPMLSNDKIKLVVEVDSDYYRTELEIDQYQYAK